MGAPKSRGMPFKRSRVVKEAEPLRNDRVVIVATFTKSGAFEITFAPYQVLNGNRDHLRRIPTLAFSVLRQQVLETHDRLWRDAGLSANPKIITDLRTLVEGAKKEDVVQLVNFGWRAVYMTVLCDNFNTACSNAGVNASMEVKGLPDEEEAVAQAEPATTAEASATKVVKKTTAKPRKR